MSIIDNISELRRESWNDIFALNFVEFCHNVRYLKAKREYENSQLEDFRNKRKI